MHNVNEEGLAALKPKGPPGRPARLSEAIAKKLEVDLEKLPCEFGLNRARWDGPTLVRHLERQYGVKLRVRQAQNWMHQLGYRLKRASYSCIQAQARDAKNFQKAFEKTPGTGT